MTPNVLEARWVEDGKNPPRWHCGLRPCGQWLAEYHNHVHLSWLVNPIYSHVLVLPHGFTKRKFGRDVVCAKSDRSGHKLEGNRALRDNLAAFADENRDPSRAKGYAELNKELKADNAPRGQLVIIEESDSAHYHEDFIISLPVVVLCPGCKRRTIIRKICDGQTARNIEQQNRELEEEFSM